jgi:hypothetical protein
VSYAEGTSVPVDRSVAELRALLQKHGADGFGCAEESSPPRAMVLFRIRALQVRLVLDFPGAEDPRISQNHRGQTRTLEDIERRVQAERRRRWRALVLVAKAKLEAVTSGISTLEREFLADLVLPNGRVVHEELAPRLENWQRTGHVLPLIPERAS